MARASCWPALLLAASALGSLLPLEVERLRASVGGFAVMNCHLDFPFGNEIPYHLQWDKDDETIFSWYSGEGAPVVADRWGGRVRLARGAGLGRGAVNVSAVRETDAGLYRCRVSFPNRTPPARNNGTFYYLDVDGGNLIVTPPMNTTVLEGELAELECLPKSPEWTVQWLRDGAPLEALPALAARAQRALNGSLLLRAAAADLGEYECRVRAPDGQVQSASAFLDVQYKAKVVYSPKERYLPFGKTASLDCHFSANPPLTNLRWEKDGFLFDPYNVPGVFYSRNGSLLFNRVDESHEGMYSCTAYNLLGSEGPGGGVRVRVQRPPALAARPRPLYLARLGATLTLPCSPEPALQTHAPPAVRWTRKDGAELPEGRYSLDEGNLTINELAEEDRGVYVCAVSNEADELAVETELLIENVPPRAPYNLTARAAYDSVHLAWVPGHNGVDVEYHVWYRERADSEWRTLKILSRGVTDATLLGLRPGADYELRVLSQDHIGDGLFSKPIFVRTLDVPLEGREQGEEQGEEEGETEVEAGEEVTSYTAAVTEGAAGAAGVAGVAAEAEAAGELQVAVRLLDEGALVRWTPGGARCSLRWYDAAEPARRLLATVATHLDYVLVSEVQEGGSYWASVQCGAAGAGGAALHVPAYARLRGVAAGAAAAALLLAAAAAALVLLRRRRARRAPDRRDKRAR